ncbi:hypothetical protein BDN72DRAFT_841907 [Pluteus cervinus]|uniref:Uncharacterized protein n=1 Tax=Pluteus cervinus TaxID=181527 RepID=A0ACD3AS48_9AGAR|nr:hypothetical protein BDN72DRAFT_841907 [Pluteus cervinus]
MTEEQRANVQERKRINATLTLEKMIADEPYTDLPYQYRAATSFKHKPPEFSRGFKFTEQEISDYAISKKIVLPQDSGTSSIPIVFSCHIIRLLGGSVNMAIGTSGKHEGGHILLAMYTNSGTTMPQEEIDKTVAWFKDEFNKEPRWYITEDSYSLESGKQDFKIPERLIWGD